MQENLLAASQIVQVIETKVNLLTTQSALGRPGGWSVRAS